MRRLAIALHSGLNAIALLAATAPAAAVAAVVTQVPGVVAEAGIDALYATFADGYLELDADLVAGLYTETARYLAPEDPVVTGRAAIRALFAATFDRARLAGDALSISFEILERRVDRALAYDVGVYTLRRLGPSGGSTGRGKFTAVFVREDGGDWRFQVDSYSGLP